ncbi:MAG: DUF418 domain-containing protein [Pararhodobacter sp.]|nr:DUF418 domain-containing protein [Pararhodobacter sp.]
MAEQTKQDRHALIDSLRAVALAGVIAMNMMTFSGLAYLTPEMRAEMLGTFDHMVWAFLRIFVDGKALAAFSFMFGFSFSIILNKALAADERPGRRFIRRLGTLFLIGLFNALFLFWADILMTYALLGLILPLAARLPTRLITALALALILAAPLTLALGGYGAPAPVPRGHLDSLDAYASPQIADTLRQNWHMIMNASESADSMLVLRLFTLSGLFLLGLAAGKSGLVLALAENRARLLGLGLALTLAGLLMKLALRFAVEAEGIWALLNLQGPVMALGYLLLIGAALAGPAASGVRWLLAPLGRMTLTGYLMSAVFGQLIFYGWGFGLIGQLGTLAVLAVAAGLYALLLLFAQLWFRHFLVGPWEWLWRSMTNMKPQPIAGNHAPR